MIGLRGHWSCLYLNSNNRIVSLPEGVPGAGMPALTLLHLSSNRLGSLPESLAECATLESLYANSNALTAIPNALVSSVSGVLGNLKRLNLSNNQIRFLPSGFTERFGKADDTTGMCSKVSGVTTPLWMGRVGSQRCVC